MAKNTSRKIIKRLKRSELARELGVSKQAVSAQVKKGKWRTEGKGRQLVVLLSQLDLDMIKQMKKERLNPVHKATLVDEERQSEGQDESQNLPVLREQMSEMRSLYDQRIADLILAHDRELTNLQKSHADHIEDLREQRQQMQKQVERQAARIKELERSWWKRLLRKTE